jgi:hypothetical protein
MKHESMYITKLRANPILRYLNPFRILTLCIYPVGVSQIFSILRDCFYLIFCEGNSVRIYRVFHSCVARLIYFILPALISLVT